MDEFGKKYTRYISLNLEDFDTKKLISQSFADTVKAIERDSGASLHADDTLLFLDEIQGCPDVIPHIRFFLEKLRRLHLIWAGSLLDGRAMLEDHVLQSVVQLICDSLAHTRRIFNLQRRRIDVQKSYEIR
ncbi:MAG: AAA family ATPase [Chitinivibrionales bacterium]|nr:AAA family ATPase [Chitinivibrionales bacterium]